MVRRLLVEPPQPFDPPLEPVKAGTVLYRVHEPVFPGGVTNDGTVPNPGFGKPTRFAFFGEPVIPVLYAADQPAGAVHESILHDVEAGEFVPGAHWRAKVLTALEVVRDIEVAAFHSAGLRRFGLYASDLTDTGRAAYPQTVRWAQAAWKAGAQGVAYMCRHFNSSKALCLFADSLPSDAFRPVPDHPHGRVFALPEDAEWLASLALDMRVTLRP